MTSQEIRKKYLDFFAKKGHKIIPSASLVPSESVDLAGTQRVMFTTAGMHPLVPYLLGEEHPEGKRLVNVQKCLRTDDIDDVGDNTHNTFFEMLGNWSLGDPASPDGIGLGGYWKEEAISWSFEFLTKVLKLNKTRLYVSVFAGDDDAPFDKESFEIWQRLGIEENRIFKYSKLDNWWGPVGQVGPCGPDTEMFYDTDPKSKSPIDPSSNPRFVEIWNDVFMQYDKQDDGSFKPLKQKNVDTGMGLERILAVINNVDDVFQTDLFSNSIRTLEAIKKAGKSYKEDPIPYRVIVDHLRSAIFLIGDGVKPSNKERGYVLRRIIRRSMVYSRRLGMQGDEWLSNCLPELVRPYIKVYPNLKKNIPEISQIITQEVDKFRTTLEAGIKALKKIFSRAISGIDPENLPPGMKLENNVIRVDGYEVFKIYETFGLPPEISQEIMTGWGLAFDDRTMEECYQAMKKHQELSREMGEKTKGGLAVQSDTAAKYHTATHLLHQALREVLGNHVYQTGSHITNERLRFDFSHGDKLTGEQLKKVEDLVNGKIKENLKVEKELMSQEEADKLGAIGLFKEKYGEKVSIYKIDDFSIEYCGGPHATTTGDLGRFKILKEESLGTGKRRVYAILG
ncbi:MAG TPA: alanine--tRNA ligase [Patescibacteria group bacterium]